ncbi:hypothetical protein T02_10244, partial [Trichinella nativa]
LRYANNDHHKGALSSVTVHSFRCAMQITIAIKGVLSSIRAHSFV